MPNFSYKARDKYGVPMAGIMEGATSAVIAARLAGMGYTPVSIIEQEVSATNNLEDVFAALQGVKTEEMIIFIRQLSSILGAGVPLLESLEAVYEQIPSRKFKGIVMKIKRDIEAGSSFSDALGREPKVFTPVFSSMIKAGERAGILSEVLERLASLLERDFENAQKITSATRYPMMVIIALGGAFMVVITFVVPKFEALYSAMQGELPLPTRILLGLNFVLTHYILYIIAVAAGVYYGLKKFLLTESGGLVWDRTVLSLPVFGTLVSKLMLSRFCRMLAAMLKSGIPVLEALAITKQTVENRVIAAIITNIEDEIIRGGSISEPMRGSKIFPPLAVQMVAIGERAGALESMLNKVADYFDRDADYMIKNLQPLLEPFLILILAVMVSILALGVLMPMYDMIKLVKS